jgi:hypothetical protein
MKNKATIGCIAAFMILFCLGLPALVIIGFSKLIQAPIQAALPACISDNCIVPEPTESESGMAPSLPNAPLVPARQWHIIRIPQTIGLTPGQSALPLKLANIPDLQGTLYGDNVTFNLQDIVLANRGRDIVISFGGTRCNVCLDVIRTFGEFKSKYGDAVAFVATVENDPGRLQILIPRYSLNPDLIFVSDIANLDIYYLTALQGYRYQPIVVHINPEGSVDRILISSFGSIENLKAFIGIDLQEVF